MADSDLLKAAQEDNYYLVKQLIKAGADINARCDEWYGGYNYHNDDDMKTPLFLALEHKHLTSNDSLIAKELLAHPNIDMNLQFGENEETVLHMAIEKRETNKVKMILENGQNIDFGLENEEGLTGGKRANASRGERSHDANMYPSIATSHRRN